MTSDDIKVLRNTIDSQQNQIKHVIDMINEWAKWAVTINNVLTQHEDKISYLEKTLNGLIVSRNCITCFGFGLHTDKRPMEQMDAIHGMRTIPCPECGANLNGK